MADPYCVANRPLRVKNCLPMVDECKSEISVMSSLALLTIHVE
jgi:hypothetical protein